MQTQTTVEALVNGVNDTASKAEMTTDVAIIGMACRFPGAANYRQYWQNLSEGHSAIVEIPADRWDWQAIYGDSDQGENTTPIKWGGFISDIDKFDPLFFNISPKEANYTDPQHRIFLEAVWHAIEDAGYSSKALAGQKIGVYAGVSKNDYAELMRATQQPIISFVSTGTVHSILANRVSYLLDFHGKSEVVDTACSSFLVALNNAVDDIRSGYCQTALVGGVNAILAPTMYISHRQSGMLSDDGRCKTFDASANGYVRSEGVGVVMIKSLSQALADNDQLLGVIKGCATAHGGWANTLTSPNVNAQAAVVSAALIDAKVDPRSIGYIEAHGTGTPLGDPIEINGLKKAYQPYLKGDEGQYCGLSSVKTNVGHLESAAGIAGLIKVLLSFKHQQIPGLLHFNQLNPYIELDDSPFYIVDKLQPWRRNIVDGQTMPLRAAISSFGMGGVNAHVIIEEPPQRHTREDQGDPQLILISAKKGRLSAQVQQLLDYLSAVAEPQAQNGPFTLQNLAYTLMFGRDEFDQRLAFVAASLAEVKTQLTRYLQHEADGDVKAHSADPSGYFHGVAKSAHKRGRLPVQASDELAFLAKNWSQGQGYEWQQSQFSGQRIPLPGYPFARRRCWFGNNDTTVEQPSVQPVSPSASPSLSPITTAPITAAAAPFAQIFPTESRVADHRVQQQKMLPAAGYLDVLRLRQLARPSAPSAVRPAASPSSVWQLNDVYWLTSLVVADQPVAVSLTSNDQQVTISSDLNQGTEHCQATVLTEPHFKAETFDLTRFAALQSSADSAVSHFTQQPLYELFSAHGLAYGPTFQVIEQLSCRDNLCIAQLRDDNGFDVGIIDGVFQAAVALSISNGSAARAQYVPYYLANFAGLAEVKKLKTIYVEQTQGVRAKASGQSPQICQFNMIGCDASGQVIIRFDHFSKRILSLAQAEDAAAGTTMADKSVAATIATEAAISIPAVTNPAVTNPAATNPSVVYYSSQWTKAAVSSQLSTLNTPADQPKPPLLLINGSQAIQQQIAQHYAVQTLSYSAASPAMDEALLGLKTQLASQPQPLETIVIEAITPGQDDLAMLLSFIQGLIKAKYRQNLKIIYLAYADSDASLPLIFAAAGFARTLAFENSRYQLTVVAYQQLDDCLNRLCGELGGEIGAEIGAEIGGAAAPLHEVLYCHEGRFVRSMQAVTLPDLTTTELPLRQHGCYVLIGGAGGLGQIFSRYLATTVQAKLILVGSRQITPAITTFIADIDALGGSASYVAVNITDKAALNSALSAVREQHGNIHGVIHGGGLIEDNFILNTSAESMARVLAPKITGTINLDECTAEDDLDFFVMFSSVAALMPNQGQCSYAAGNSFMDGYAGYRHQLVLQQQRRGLSLAVNWPLWANGGMGVGVEDEAHLKEEFGMVPLATDKGLAIFQTLLANGYDAFDHLLCMQSDETDFNAMLAKIDRHFNITTTSTSTSTSTTAAASWDLSDDSVLAKLLLNDLKVLFALVAKIPVKQRSLVDGSEGDERFADWALSSLAYSEVSGLINQWLGLNVKPTIFFECASIGELHQQLLAKYRSELVLAYSKMPNGMAQHSSFGLIDVEKSDRAQHLYQRRYDNQEFYMVDHVVQEKYNVPGACYIEMARQAAMLDRPGVVISALTNNYWAKQLSSAGAPFNAYIQLQPKAHSSDYEIYSLAADFAATESGQPEKTIHATGTIEYGQSGEPLAAERLDLATIRQRCPISRSRDEVYQQIHAEGLKVGPSFMPMTAIVMNEHEALATLELPLIDGQATGKPTANGEDTFSDYLFHPSLLTGVFQTALINNRYYGDDDRKFIPIAIDNLRFDGGLPRKCWVYSQVKATARQHADLKKFVLRICDEQGNVLVRLDGFTIKSTAAKTANVASSVAALAPSLVSTPTPALTPAFTPAFTPALASDGQGDRWLTEQLQNRLKTLLAPAIGIAPEEIEVDEDFETYGINSLMIIELNKIMQHNFGGGHSKTLFFENDNIEQLSEYFIEEHRDTIAGLFVQPAVAAVAQPVVDTMPVQTMPVQTTVSQPQQSQPAPQASGPEAIAIVGIAGQYPQADNLDQLWQNLVAGSDCTEIFPAARFDFLADETADLVLANTRGGFIADVDKFDPLFFNISPKEAQRIDPQERLLLQTAWHTLENAGYSRQGLAAEEDGLNIGVFIGAIWQPYTALGVEATERGEAIGPSGLLYNTANRISYYFNFSGPSLAVDTACSASLTALHLACNSIKVGDCQGALVGGINLSIDASKYLFLGQNSFLSSEGKCRTFGAGGDGYVPGEGVGMIYIKPLSAAIAAGDHIHGVIKGSAINHGGKTSGYTVPNPTAQTAVIRAALKNSGVAPSTIGYVEAHGTGTSLGDPIEITGLSKIYQQADQQQFCAIGSIKSNIGHLEANAGLAGLTKILLQMKYQQLVPSIHSSELNPNIDFAKTPFYVQRANSPWPSESGQPRRSALSSFGAGGANAHVIIEQYLAPLPNTNEAQSNAPQLVILSAKTPAQLAEMVNNLHDFIVAQRQAAQHYPHLADVDQPQWLVNLAYTLQVGREAMAHRVAFIVSDSRNLERQLAAYGAGQLEANGSGVYHGEVDRQRAKGLMKDQDYQATVKQWLAKAKLDFLAQNWVDGVDIRWQDLAQGSAEHASVLPRTRLPLPVYPFARQSYWLPAPAAQAVRPREPALTTVAVTPREPLPAANQLLYFTPQWQDQPMASITAPEQVETVIEQPILFICTLQKADHNALLVQQLKSGYPGAKVINVTQTLDFDGPQGFSLALYQQLLATLQQLCQRQQGVNRYRLVLLTEPTAMGFFDGFAPLLKSLLAEQVIKQAKQLVLPVAMTTSECLNTIYPEIQQWAVPPETADFAQVSYCAGQRQVKGYQEVSWSAEQRLEHSAAGQGWRANGVYWITGGLGAMGQLFINQLSQRLPQVQWIVSGRGGIDEPRVAQALQQWQDQGVQVSYFQGDIATQHGCELLLATILIHHPQIHGVIHGAGNLNDGLFLNKNLQLATNSNSAQTINPALANVLAPKMAGCVFLDELTKDMALDIFVCFSSVSSIFGNRGQTDYALANGFMDAFIHYREQLHQQGKRSGKSLTINWPLWAEGGMQVDDATRQWLKQQWGVVPLPSDIGMTCLDDCLIMAHQQVIPLYGDPVQIARNPYWFADQLPAVASPAVASSAVAGGDVAMQLKQWVAELLQMDLALIDDHTDIKDYGFDSISLTGLANQINRHYQLNIGSGTFYDIDSIAKIAEYVTQHQPPVTGQAEPRLSVLLTQANDEIRAKDLLPASPSLPTMPAAADQSDRQRQIPIAVIGIDGRFPGAQDVNQFWQQILTKQVSVATVGQDPFRFSDGSVAAFSALRSGLISGVDRFDAEFFAIDPQEARLMDPQQRLLLESVWRAVEDGGYQMATLAKGLTGLFVGVGSSDYLQLMCADQHTSDAFAQVGISPSMLANRISHLLNLKGPSEICDTACSSSVVALHRAMRALHEGDCQVALVGGVNLLLSLRGYHGLQDLGLLSPSQQTYSFDARADGYVRGEGVGTVLLKPLAQAEADRDNIYGVLRGSAVYHGGKSNLSLIAPNKEGQSQAIIQAYQRAGIDPHTVQYIEAHGTGTTMGDPAEISALKQAFRYFAANAQHNGNENGTGNSQPDTIAEPIGVGAIKPNIGHLEAASGMAALIKVIMALKTQQKPPLAGFEALSLGMSFANSPFYIVKEAEAWQPLMGADGQPIARRASLNSYGFGGVNAHLVLEEYIPTQAGVKPVVAHGVAKTPAPATPQIITLSAPDPDSLAAKVQALRGFIVKQNDPSALRLEDMSYTLTTGRGEMAARLAMVVTSWADLIDCLDHYFDHRDCFYQLSPLDQTTRIESELAALEPYERARRLAQHWAAGGRVDWLAWFSQQSPYKIPLPTHQFNGQSYWFNQN